MFCLVTRDQHKMGTWLVENITKAVSDEGLHCLHLHLFRQKSDSLLWRNSVPQIMLFGILKLWWILIEVSLKSWCWSLETEVLTLLDFAHSSSAGGCRFGKVVTSGMGRNSSVMGCFHCWLPSSRRLKTLEIFAWSVTSMTVPTYPVAELLEQRLV